MRTGSESTPPPPCCAEEYQAETRLMQTGTEKPVLNTRLHNPEKTRAVVQAGAENDSEPAEARGLRCGTG